MGKTEETTSISMNMGVKRNKDRPNKMLWVSSEVYILCREKSGKMNFIGPFFENILEILPEK